MMAKKSSAALQRRIDEYKRLYGYNEDLEDLGPLADTQLPHSFEKDFSNFSSLRPYAKVAFSIFLKTLSGGELSEISLGAYRSYKGSVFLAGYTGLTASRAKLFDDGEDIVQEVMFRMRREEAEFCCKMQEAAELQTAESLLDFLNHAIRDLALLDRRIRQPFYLAAMANYAPAFAILDYAPEEVRNKYEQFKAEALSAGLDVSLKNLIIPGLPDSVKTEDQERRRIVSETLDKQIAKTLRIKAEADRLEFDKLKTKMAESEKEIEQKIATGEQLWIKNNTGVARLKLMVRFSNGYVLHIPPGGVERVASNHMLFESEDFKRLLMSGALVFVSGPEAAEIQTQEERLEAYARSDADFTQDMVTAMVQLRARVKKIPRDW